MLKYKIKFVYLLIIILFSFQVLAEEKELVKFEKEISSLPEYKKMVEMCELENLENYDLYYFNKDLFTVIFVKKDSELNLENGISCANKECELNFITFSEKLTNPQTKLKMCFRVNQEGIKISSQELKKKYDKVELIEIFFGDYNDNLKVWFPYSQLSLMENNPMNTKIKLSPFAKEALFGFTSQGEPIYFKNILWEISLLGTIEGEEPTMLDKKFTQEDRKSYIQIAVGNQIIGNKIILNYQLPEDNKLIINRIAQDKMIKIYLGSLFNLGKLFIKDIPFNSRFLINTCEVSKTNNLFTCSTTYPCAISSKKGTVIINMLRDNIEVKNMNVLTIEDLREYNLQLGSEIGKKVKEILIVNQREGIYYKDAETGEIKLTKEIIQKLFNNLFYEGPICKSRSPENCQKLVNFVEEGIKKIIPSEQIAKNQEQKELSKDFITSLPKSKQSSEYTSLRILDFQVEALKELFT